MISILAINNFLDISRLESGKMEFNRETFQLDELLRDVVEDISFIHKTQSIEFTTSCQLKTYTDQDKISAVIFNLISNSIKYAPYDSTVKITCSEAEDGILVGVEDLGPGIKVENF